MPFINVKTNIAVSPDKLTAVKAQLGNAITAIPGKSEHWLMVAVEPETALYFQGTDAPAAMVQVQIYGTTSGNACEALTGKICAILETELSIPADRVYVSYWQTPNWGWNNSNF
ncbi:MAG: hypothetical protein K2I93_00925 [Oscillospiraceae bacterium]|nr:hypothetical protein [Oscillospiraceae bacterium]